MLVEDGLRQVFRDNFLLDLDQKYVWCRDIEHDKPRYTLFAVSWDAVDPDPMPAFVGLTKRSPTISKRDQYYSCSIY